MSNSENISEMLVHVGGDLLKSAHSLQEMQARVDMVKIAWNMSLNTQEVRKIKLKQFLKKQKKFAPSKEALKSLESEIKKIIIRKLELYPGADKELERAEVVEKAKDEYEIKAYFNDDTQPNEA